MDWTDIIILAAILLPIFIKFRKKKQAKSSHKPRPVETVSPNRESKNAPIAEDASFEDFDANSSKNDEYFTYETLEPEVSENFDEVAYYSQKNVENNQQIIENEEVKNTELQFDTEEIKKGIIYSIILEKPYNQ